MLPRQRQLEGFVKSFELAYCAGFGDMSTRALLRSPCSSHSESHGVITVALDPPYVSASVLNRVQAFLC